VTDDAGQLEADLEAIREYPIFFAYNANVDALVRVDADLEAALDPPADPPGEAKAPDRLETTSDLSTAIARSMARGEGDEIPMSRSLADELESGLTPDEQRMGGQAGIMSNLLSVLGASPVVYTYLLSETQRSMFQRPEAVRFPVVEDGEVDLRPVSEVTNADRTKINWVFEFSEGTEFFGVRAAEDTRFIAASRPMEFDLTADDLDPVVDQVGEAVDSAVLAGYHNLTPDHVPDGYDERLLHGRTFIRNLRAGGTSAIQVESAVTHDEALRDGIVGHILPEADVFGLDTHELDMFVADLDLDRSVAPDVSTPDASETPDVLRRYRTLAALRDHLGVDCLKLHAMNYHLAVLDDGAYRPPERVERGLEFAAVAAAAKATHGSITAPEDVQAGLSVSPSDAGREAVETLAAALDESVREGSLTTSTVVACPNRVVDDPVSTVGIGDVISSSSFALENALENGDGT
jgi:ADP-dependent phosphofructokinase/glucokinase